MSQNLYVATRIGTPKQGDWLPIGVLRRVGDFYRFGYTRGIEASAGVRPLPGMPDPHRLYESKTLFPLFANRLLSSSRPEYEEYLRWGGFDPLDPPDPLAILGLTGGSRQTDQIEIFPCPARDADGRYTAKFFLHGLRWRSPQAVATASMLPTGTRLNLRPEPDNARDEFAVALDHVADDGSIGHHLGYVPRYLARDVHRLRDGCGEDVEVRVVRTNPAAPAQMRLLCRLEACWPDGFKPCADDVYEPLDATADESELAAASAA
ncbi:MAG: HIRAN domain-containing protein [Planctomycetota bacterium]